MITKTGAIECNGVDASRFSLFCNARADDSCRFDVAAILDALANLRLECRRSREDFVAACTDDLRVNMARRAMNAQAINLEFTDLCAAPAGTT